VTPTAENVSFEAN